MQTTPTTPTSPRPKPPPLPPGPKGWPVVGLLPRWQKDPLGLLAEVREAHGDLAHITLGVHTTMVTAPDQVKHVLQDNHLNYVKGFDYQRMEPLLGHGLLTSNGEEWRRHRRLAQPGFHRQRVAGFGALMVRLTHAMLRRWRALGDGAEVDVHAEFMRLTLEIVGEALFSAELGDVTRLVGEALGEALEMTDERVNSLVMWPLWVPTPFNTRYRARLAVLDRVVRDIISARRARPASDDLLSMLMEARDEGDAALDDTALRDEVMTLILAGHETTANALTFTHLLLTRHPDVERHLHEAVTSAVGTRAPEAGDAATLGFARQVAEETMRLYPPAWIFGRQALADDVIGGCHVPAKSLVMCVPYLTHRDPRWWPDPLRFDPRRFAPDHSAARHRFAFYPFSAGPRQCIGNGFAVLELQLILATLSQHVRIEALTPDQVDVEASITLRPKNGLRARLWFR